MPAAMPNACLMCSVCALEECCDSECFLLLSPCHAFFGGSCRTHRDGHTCCSSFPLTGFDEMEPQSIFNLGFSVLGFGLFLPCFLFCFVVCSHGDSAGILMCMSFSILTCAGMYLCPVSHAEQTSKSFAGAAAGVQAETIV